MQIVVSTGLKWSESHSVVSDSLWPHAHSPWNSPGQNTGVGSLSLLQGILPTQGSNPGLPHCRGILYQLSHQGSLRILEWVAYPFSRYSQPRDWTQVSRIAGGFFTSWAIREAQPWLRAFFKKLTSWQGEIFIWRFFFKPSNFRFFLNNNECLFKFRNSIWDAIPFNTSISKSVHLSIQLSLHLPLSRCIQVKISGIMWMLRVCRWWNFSKLVFYTFYTALF